MSLPWQHRPTESRNPFQPNFGETARDYRRFRTGFPAPLFDRLAEFQVGLAGRTLLDVGTGTGFLARDFALRGCRVTGLDPQAALLEQARALDAETGVTIEYRQGRAEELPFADHTFDVVTAGQCWHWFDRPTAAREVRRVLVPGGKLVICHFDWLPLAGNVVQATETLIQRYNPAWNMGGGTGIYPQWLRDVGEAGFLEIESFSFDSTVTFTHAAWIGRIRASSGVGASMSPDVLEKFEHDLEQILLTHFPSETWAVPHRVFALVCANPR